MVILPLEGISFNGAKVRLGASESEVKAVLGEPERVINGSLYYFGNELRFDPGENGVEFIEFLGGADGALQPTIYGVPAFKTGADELYALLAEKNDGGIDDHENGYSYAFLTLSVGVYRESIPESVEEMITEAESEGFPMSAEDIAEERKKAAYWAAIGIGCAGYYGNS
ncbi:MAG: hypothetical protein K2N38_11030 [Oscillospiraceae bacterium]|nr:hypothetical protein [Oscillospiraceae bacterium]